MPNPALAVQKAIRLRLTATAAVTSLVPAASILDTNQRPAPDPSIIIGEDQIVDPGMMLDRSVVRIHSTLHIWKTETGLAGAKAIGGAVWDAIASSRLSLDAGLKCVDCRPTDMRFMRDPEGTMSHGVVTIETLVRK
jgi:hypothetical protein